MSLANQRASPEYQEAVKVTEEIESPSLGFIRPSDHKAGVNSQNTAIIKQNNTLIYLVIKQAQRLEEIGESIERLKRNIEALVRKESEPAELDEAIKGLTQRLESLTVSGKAPVGGKKGPIYVFKDPNKIFEEEYGREKSLKK